MRKGNAPAATKSRRLALLEAKAAGGGGGGGGGSGDGPRKRARAPDAVELERRKQLEVANEEVVDEAKAKLREWLDKLRANPKSWRPPKGPGQNWCRYCGATVASSFGVRGVRARACTCVHVHACMCAVRSPLFRAIGGCRSC